MWLRRPVGSAMSPTKHTFSSSLILAEFVTLISGALPSPRTCIQRSYFSTSHNVSSAHPRKEQMWSRRKLNSGPIPFVDILCYQLACTFTWLCMPGDRAFSPTGLYWGTSGNRTPSPAWLQYHCSKPVRTRCVCEYHYQSRCLVFFTASRAFCHSIPSFLPTT